MNFVAFSIFLRQNVKLFIGLCFRIFLLKNKTKVSLDNFLQSLHGLSTLISPDRIKNCMDRDAKCLNERSNNLMMPHLALLKLERRKALCLEKVFLHYNVIVLYVHNLFQNSVEPLSWHIKKIIWVEQCKYDDSLCQKRPTPPWQNFSIES